MAKVIHLHLDQSFEEHGVKTIENKLILNKMVEPNFIIGKSVFKEKPFPFWKRLFMFWKKRRELMIYLDGCPTACSLEEDEGKPALAFNFGTIKETTSFIAKVVQKSKADTKPMSNNMFLILALMLGAVLMFQFMLLKGMKI